jgi:dTDP-4-dehydrorhamnose 3,5-epimerase
MGSRSAVFKEVLLFTPKKFDDNRGFLSEIYNKKNLGRLNFIQDNLSFSLETGTIRGLHFQIPPYAQDKLVIVLQGSILDIVVDIRHGSPTYKRWQAVELRSEDLGQILIPAGFAHGFCTLKPNTLVLYKVTNNYSPTHERGILWNDPDLGVAWPVAAQDAILSEKDRRNPCLADLEGTFE